MDEPLQVSIGELVIINLHAIRSNACCHLHVYVACVNFSFFIAVPFGDKCWYYAECKMVLHKIDGEMNMQNCVFSAK